MVAQRLLNRLLRAAMLADMGDKGRGTDPLVPSSSSVLMDLNGVLLSLVDPLGILALGAFKWLLFFSLESFSNCFFKSATLNIAFSNSFSLNRKNEKSSELFRNELFRTFSSFFKVFILCTGRKPDSFSGWISLIESEAQA